MYQRIVSVVCAVVFLSISFIQDCSRPEYEKVMVGTWRLNRLQTFEVRQNDTTLVRENFIEDSLYHVFTFRNNGTVVQQMQGDSSEGSWLLNGTRLKINLPYYKDSRDVTRIVHPGNMLLKTYYARGDSELFVTTFVKDES